MAIEIERKFLVSGDGWRQADARWLSQGYLNRDPLRTVRVRVAGPQAFLTIKGPNDGIRRMEFEYPIPLPEAEALLALCDGPLIQKFRHRVAHADLVWEVDEFHGANAGLVVAEVELPSEDHPFQAPPWLGQEVSDDPRYFNSSLSRHPFCDWVNAGAGS
jgi:adenylate cyclase